MTPPKQVWYVTGPAFWQPYLYPSNLWAIYHGFTHTHATPYQTELRKICNITSLLGRLSYQPLVFGPLFYVICGHLAECSLGVIGMGRVYPTMILQTSLVGYPAPLLVVALFPAELAVPVLPVIISGLEVDLLGWC
jgi:hypothetical protein